LRWALTASATDPVPRIRADAADDLLVPDRFRLGAAHLDHPEAVARVVLELGGDVLRDGQLDLARERLVGGRVAGSFQPAVDTIGPWSRRAWRWS